MQKPKNENSKFKPKFTGTKKYVSSPQSNYNIIKSNYNIIMRESLEQTSQ